MSAASSKPKPPRCSGALKDGSPCLSLAVSGEELCPHHLRKWAEAEAEAEAELLAEPVPVEPEVPDGDEREEVEPEAERGGVLPGAFRGQLAADAASDYEAIRTVLTDARKATKNVYMSCSHCGKRSEVEVVDHRTALDAVKLWIEAGFGRAAAAPADEAADLRAKSHDVLLKAMTHEELSALRARILLQSPKLIPWFLENLSDFDVLAEGDRAMVSTPGGLEAAAAVTIGTSPPEPPFFPDPRLRPRRPTPAR